MNWFNRRPVPMRVLTAPPQTEGDQMRAAFQRHLALVGPPAHIVADDTLDGQGRIHCICVVCSRQG